MSRRVLVLRVGGGGGGGGGESQFSRNPTVAQSARGARRVLSMLRSERVSPRATGVCRPRRRNALVRLVTCQSAPL